MGNPTKVSVIESLKALGVEVDEKASYKDLVAKLASLQPKGTESVAESEPEEDVPEKEEEDVPRITPEQSAPTEEEADVEDVDPPASVAPSVPEEPVPPRIQATEPVVNAVEKEDYLRQYQYKKQADFGSKASDPAPGSKADKMKQFLLSQDKIRIIIPRLNKEDPSIKHSVTLNGYRLDLPKQQYLELPLQVAMVIMDSLEQTESAIMRGQISAAKENQLA